MISSIKKWFFYYFEKSASIVSNISTGPVEPKIVKGWPLNKPKISPLIRPDNKLSNEAFLKLNTYTFLILYFLILSLF